MNTIHFFLDGRPLSEEELQSVQLPRGTITLAPGTVLGNYKVTEVVDLQRAEKPKSIARQIHLARIH
jgi:hypothetical protein